MSSKGNVEPLVVVTLAITVLAVVGLGYYLYSADIINILEILPGFNQTVPAEKVDLKMRYDLLDESLEYYDESRWVESKDEIIFDDNVYSTGDISSSLDNFYYTSERMNIEGSNVRDIAIYRSDEGFGLKAYVFSHSGDNEFYLNYDDSFYSGGDYDEEVFGVIKTTGEQYKSLISMYDFSDFPQFLRDHIQEINDRYILYEGEIVGRINPFNLKISGSEDYSLIFSNRQQNGINRDRLDVEIYYLGKPLGIKFSIEVNYDEQTIKGIPRAGGHVYSDISGGINDASSYSEQKEIMVSWRDSILKGGDSEKPIRLSYIQNSGGGVSECASIEILVEKFDKRYLLLDFEKNVLSESDC